MNIKAHKIYNEKRLINIFLGMCLVLGFACIVGIYIPKTLSKNINKTDNIESAKFTKLLNLLPEKQTKDKINNKSLIFEDGVYTKFTPEPEPEPLAPNIVEKDKHNQFAVSDKEEYTFTSSTKVHEKSSLAKEDSNLESSKYFFKTPKELKTDVAFWKYIYSKYSSNQVVFHDPEYLSIIYSVLDFENINKDINLTEEDRKKTKQKLIEEEKEKIEAILTKLEKSPDSENLSVKEQRIQKIFQTFSEKDKFNKAKKRGIRAQLGQADRFLQGLIYSGRYLGEIESILKEQGLPTELTRLIFVESMFNMEAHSYAGAKGIWQFMEDTAKFYSLKLNTIFDERSDPIKSSHAAIKLLKQNYDELGTWPLAINAYNAGRGRLKQAVEQLGTHNIVTIVRKFKHNAYKFASRNFYMEFLAALDIVNNYQDYFGAIQFDKPLRYDTLQINKPIILPKVAKASGIDMEDIIKLNLSFKKVIINGERHLPAGTEIRIPENKGETFIASAKKIPQTYPIIHIIDYGEKLEDIARMYNVPVAKIFDSNANLKSKLRSGQKIRILK